MAQVPETTSIRTNCLICNILRTTSLYYVIFLGFLTYHMLQQIFPSYGVIIRVLRTEEYPVLINCSTEIPLNTHSIGTRCHHGHNHINRCCYEVSNIIAGGALPYRTFESHHLHEIVEISPRDGMSCLYSIRSMPNGNNLLISTTTTGLLRIVEILAPM